MRRCKVCHGKMCYGQPPETDSCVGPVICADCADQKRVKELEAQVAELVEACKKVMEMQPHTSMPGFAQNRSRNIGYDDCLSLVQCIVFQGIQKA